MAVDWHEHITSSPDVLRGKARMKGTRVPVSLVLGYLADGFTPAQIIEELPEITEQHIAACLDYARQLTEADAVV